MALVLHHYYRKGMALMESAFHSGFAAIVGRPNVGKINPSEYFSR